MYYNRQGSIVFLLLMFIVSLSVIIYSSLRTTNYFMDLIRAREKYELHYQLVQGLHDFVLVNYRLQIKEYLLSKQTEEREFFKGSWPDENSSYSGRCWISKKQEKNNVLLSLHTNLIYKHKVIIAIQSFL